MDLANLVNECEVDEATDYEPIDTLLDVIVATLKKNKFSVWPDKTKGKSLLIPIKDKEGNSFTVKIVKS